MMGNGKGRSRSRSPKKDSPKKDSSKKKRKEKKRKEEEKKRKEEEKRKEEDDNSDSNSNSDNEYDASDSGDVQYMTEKIDKKLKQTVGDFNKTLAGMNINIKEPNMYNQIPLQQQRMYNQIPLQQLPLAVPMQQMSSQPNSLSTILPILLNISTILEKLETRIDKIENIKKVKLESFSPSPDSDSETQGVIGDIRKLMKNIPNPFQYSSNY